MNYKRRLIILVCTIFIYIIILISYNRINNNTYNEFFILKKDVLKGESINIEDLEKVYIKSNDTKLTKNNQLNKVNTNLNDFVFSKDLTKGTLLLETHFIEKIRYDELEKEYEIISIKISNSDDMASYQLEKNNIVNVYYTGNEALNENILKDLKLPYIKSSINNTNMFEDKYITVKLLEEVKIVGLFDKYGNCIESKNNVKNEANKIDTVMFKVKKDLVLKINNLKNYGQFSLSIIK